MPNLTPMQERFCQEVAGGKSQAAAYRVAYPRSLQWKNEESVWVAASRLMANTNVSLRVAELRAELAKASLWTRERAVETLMGVIESPDKQADIIAAAKVLNEMHDFNSPVKLNVTGGMNVVVRYED